MYRRIPFAAIAVLALALPVVAQNVDIEALSGLQFNFGNPGARSLGMGGAFLGLADDASAAEANPAGLTILRKPEVSLETRNYEEQQLFTTSGVFPDLVRTPFKHYSDRVVVTFASAVVPWRRFTFGAYFHEPLNNAGAGLVAPVRDEITGVLTDVPAAYVLIEGGRINGDPVTLDECLQRNSPTLICSKVSALPFISALSVRQRTFGAAAAWQVHPKLSLGVALRHQRFKEGAFTFRYTANSVAVQATGKIKGNGIEIVEESDTTFGVGFHWRPKEWLGVGGVYKKGPTFAAPFFYSSPTTGSQFIELAQTSFHIPDIAGAGLSVRPMPALTVNFDAVRVTYSNLVDDFAPLSSAVRELDQPFRADDVTELRLGAEYLFDWKIPFALRGGAWRDPAHAVTWNGPLSAPDFITEAMLFPEGQDQTHLSIGGGFAFPDLQIDFAYDTAKNYKVGSISIVKRFSPRK